jgi:hypothetical protein
MILGRTILLPRHEAQQRSQTNKCEKQRAPKAESQTQHHFRESAERGQERHCNPPTLLPSAALVFACRLSL